MISSGGENVASREVEEARYAHPAVAEVAVIGLPEEKWMERVCAVVVVRDGRADRRVAKGPSGKLLKRELRETFSS